MENGNRIKLFATVGFRKKIPMQFQNVIFGLIEILNAEAKKEGFKVDCLQVFEMETRMINGVMYQIIHHSQEQPEYESKVQIATNEAINEKVFLVRDECEDKQIITALLASEY